jgi:hypothetical protein
MQDAWGRLNWLDNAHSLSCHFIYSRSLLELSGFGLGECEYQTIMFATRIP